MHAQILKKSSITGCMFSRLVLKSIHTLVSLLVSWLVVQKGRLARFGRFADWLLGMLLGWLVICLIRLLAS